MARWVQSDSYYFVYGDEYSKTDSDKHNTFRYPDFEALREGLERISLWLQKNQWKICAVTPLTYSHSFANCESDYSASSHWGWGWGLGFAINPIIGMVIFVQRELEISDEEYAERMSGIKKKEQLEELKKQLPGLQEAVQKDQAADLKVVEKKGLLGGQKFVLNDTAYKTREEAEAMLVSLKTGCTERAAALDNLQREVQQLTVEVEALQSKYGDMK